MTITFACPNCNGVISAPDQTVGAKTNCQYCNQRIQVPGNNLAITLLGKTLVPKGATPMPLATPAVAALLQKNWQFLKGDEFEEFLVEVFHALGYQAIRSGRAGSRGLDILLTDGTRKICVRAKGCTGKVSDAAIGDSLMGMRFHGCDCCYVITNSEFTGPARATARGVACFLVDRLMIEDLIKGLIIHQSPIVHGPASPNHTVSAPAPQQQTRAPTPSVQCYRCGCNMPRDQQHRREVVIESGFNTRGQTLKMATKTVCADCAAGLDEEKRQQEEAYRAALREAKIAGEQANAAIAKGFFVVLAVLGPVVVFFALYHLASRQEVSTGGDQHGNQKLRTSATSRITIPPSLPTTRRDVARSIPQLRLALKDKSAPTRRRAAEELRQHGVEAAAATDDLKSLLTDPDPTVRAASARAIAAIGPAAHASIGALAIAVGDGNAEVSKSAAEALDKIGPPTNDDVPVLQAALASSSAKARAASLRLLAKVSLDAADGVQLFTDAYGDDNEQVRQQAIEGLTAYLPIAKPLVLPTLLKGLNDTEGIRAACAKALATAAVNGGDTEGLIVTLKSREPEVRLLGAQLLGKIGPNAKDAATSLGDLLNDPNLDVRIACASALAAIGPEAKGTLFGLMQKSKDPDVRLRVAVAQALWAIELSSANAMPICLALLQEKEPSYRLAAAELLGRMGPEGNAAAPALVAALDDADPQVGRAAGAALERIGNLGKESVPGLIAALGSKKADVRSHAAKALGGASSMTSEAVQALRGVLNDSELMVRKHALAALGKIGPEAIDAVPELVIMLKIPETHADVRDAIVKIGPGAVPHLIRIIRDLRDTKGRIELIGILGDMREQGRDAVPFLTGMTNDQFGSVREAAKEALAKISVKSK